MTFHTGKKEGPTGMFDSTFFFVKAAQEFGAGFGGQSTAPKKFIPKRAE